MIDNAEPVYYVLLFPSVSHVMKAERILLGEKIPIKIIPVPKTISSDCGVCIKFEEKLIDKIKSLLSEQFESMEFRKL
ncbi:MAG TPA: DUF3343 domain-containing protein [Spirochaetota bacterium]|nr:DUF3343 domain-containing protein [Spirochaetota bacterium]HPS85607.1 DUF3343 domain-containing protein [Spirochaetota bacterium]